MERINWLTDLFCLDSSLVKPFVFLSQCKGNIRYYNLEDVKLLLDIVLLTKSGCRISHLINADSLTLAQKTNGLTSDESRQNKSVNQLILSMFSSLVKPFVF